MLNIPFVLSFYDLHSEVSAVSHNWGTFIVLNFQSTPLFGGGGKAHNYVKTYFKLP